MVERRGTRVRVKRSIYFARVGWIAGGRAPFSYSIGCRPLWRAYSRRDRAAPGRAQYSY
jgi:hypothetical protein